MKQKFDRRSDIIRLIKDHRTVVVLLVLAFVIDALLLASSAAAIAPMVDWLGGNTGVQLSYISRRIDALIIDVGFRPSIKAYMFLFAFILILRSFSELAVRYLSLSLKYAIQKTLGIKLIAGFFETSQDAVSKPDQGLVINTFSREIAIIGDGLGHFVFLFVVALNS